MVTWYPRIEVMREGRTFGWTSARKATTEVLPRIGEVVAFDEDLASKQLLNLVALSPADAPTVVKVEHLVGHPGSTEVVVYIRANVAQYMNDTLAKQFDDLKERWSLHPEWRQPR